MCIRDRCGPVCLFAGVVYGKLLRLFHVLLTAVLLHKYWKFTGEILLVVFKGGAETGLRLDTVSYTHLDVYKRQVQMSDEERRELQIAVEFWKNENIPARFMGILPDEVWGLAENGCNNTSYKDGFLAMGSKPQGHYRCV